MIESGRIARHNPLPLRERVAFGLGRGPGEGAGHTLPKLLVTGFGPFPGAPENPTEALMRSLAGELPETFGAGALRALVLPTDYRKSWPILRRLYAGFAPDVVVHFGLGGRAETLVIERLAQRRCASGQPDAAGYIPASGFARRGGLDVLAATLPAASIVAALTQAGFPAAPSDDAGGYVCNATLYRSLAVAPAGRIAGFIHVPPRDRNGLSRERLGQAAAVILKAVSGGWLGRASR